MFLRVETDRGTLSDTRRPFSISFAVQRHRRTTLRLCLDVTWHNMRGREMLGGFLPILHARLQVEVGVNWAEPLDDMDAQPLEHLEDGERERERMIDRQTDRLIRGGH